jgi:hypothetical protein
VNLQQPSATVRRSLAGGLRPLDEFARFAVSGHPATAAEQHADARRVRGGAASGSCTCATLMSSGLASEAATAPVA